LAGSSAAESPCASPAPSASNKESISSCERTSAKPSSSCGLRAASLSGDHNVNAAHAAGIVEGEVNDLLHALLHHVLSAAQQADDGVRRGLHHLHLLGVEHKSFAVESC